MFCTPSSMKNAPHSATMTYMMWPMFMMMGMSMFAYLFARSACSKRWSLTRSKSRFASSSWQNTLTTFCPFIISSMKPSVLPMARCCSRKYERQIQAVIEHHHEER